MSARLTRKLPLHGGGESVRSFIHINDVVDATFKVLNDGVPGETYHISTNEIISIKDLVKKNNLKNSTVFIYISDHGLDGKWTVYESGLKIPLVIDGQEKLNQGLFQMK